MSRTPDEQGAGMRIALCLIPVFWTTMGALNVFQGLYSAAASDMIGVVLPGAALLVMERSRRRIRYLNIPR